MRIARLTLGRYGHLSDVDLAFPRAPGLHVVLGVNEAGKSTALAAIGDALFRFPPRTSYAFLHPARDLRLGIELHADDGRVGRFVRRKGSKDDLTDETGQPVPESAIAAFLAGAGRARFEHVFGLDAAALRRGGQDILEGKGEVGESILQAHTGLHGFRALADKLGEEASRLVGDRRGRRELHLAVDRFKDAKAALEARTVEPANYKAASEEHERLEASRARNTGEADLIRAERARLDRIRRTTPARLACTRARHDQAALGEVPALPADAEAQRQAAIMAREQAAHDLAQLRARAIELADALAGLPDDAGLLAEAELIDNLAAERSHIARTSRDRVEQRVIAEQRQRALAQAAERLGQPPGSGGVGLRIPDALARDAASRAILAHVRLSERHAKAAADALEARVQQSVADASLAALPPSEPSAELRAAVERVRAEGRIDADLTAAAHAEAAERAELARHLAVLPLWTGTVEELAAARVPLEATIADRTVVLERAERAREASDAQLTAHDAALAGLAADIGGLVAAGELPTPQAIAAARERRDRVWALLRRHRLDGGAPPSHAELSGLNSGASLPDLFQTLLREADLLVDRGASEAARVAAFTQLQTRQARERTARAAAVAVASAAVAAHAAALHGWQAIWREAGIEAELPPAMREWRHRRDAALAQHGRVRDAAVHRTRMAERHEAAYSALAVLVTEPADERTHTAAALLARAERVCAVRERAEVVREGARSAAIVARAATEKTSRALAGTQADLASWAGEWARATGAIGLPATASTDAGKLALDLWSQAEVEQSAWQTATDRIAEMTQSIDAFCVEAAAVACRVAPDLADADMHDAVRALAIRLADTRAAAAERAKITAEQVRLQAAFAKLAAQHARSDSTLAALRALARAEDDAMLRDVIARAAAHAAFGAEIAAREAELRGLDDGRSLAELKVEAEGVDPDTLPGRIAEIEGRLRAIAEENASFAGRLAELRAALAAMATGHDATGASQQMEDALSDADDIAARYVRTRLAHTLLRAGIDRFRRQQQGPLLGRAGELFARLTEGRYEKLGVDEGDDGKLALVAVRPHGLECPAGRLSEGTRDQLYLALRLAAIESYAARTEPLPFIADDLLVNFDDRRARATLRVLGEMGERMQVILFTHHAHIAEMAEPALTSLHHLSSGDSRLAAE